MMTHTAAVPWANTPRPRTSPPSSVTRAKFTDTEPAGEGKGIERMGVPVAIAPRACEWCSVPLVQRRGEGLAKWRRRKFCNRQCWRDAGSARTAASYSNYLVDPATGCWVWQGYADRNGYGRIYDPTRGEGRKTDWAHRAFHEKFTGAIPHRHEVDHTCQNTICVRPSHLEAVTKAEHVRRTFARLGKDDRHRLAAELRASGSNYQEIAEALSLSGRSSAAQAVEAAIRKGLVDPETVPTRSRLSESERDDIRDLYAIGIPQTEIADWYGTDSSHISRICNRLDSKAARRAAGRAS